MPGQKVLLTHHFYHSQRRPARIPGGWPPSSSSWRALVSGVMPEDCLARVRASSAARSAPPPACLCICSPSICFKPSVPSPANGIVSAGWTGRRPRLHDWGFGGGGDGVCAASAPAAAGPFAVSSCFVSHSLGSLVFVSHRGCSCRARSRSLAFAALRTTSASAMLGKGSSAWAGGSVRHLQSPREQQQGQSGQVGASKEREEEEEAKGRPEVRGIGRHSIYRQGSLPGLPLKSADSIWPPAVGFFLAGAGAFWCITGGGRKGAN